MARFGGETLSTKKSRIRKEETKSKEKKKQTGFYEDPFQFARQLFQQRKKGFAFSTERTAEGPPKENIF